MVKECKGIGKEGVDAKAGSSLVLPQACLLSEAGPAQVCWLGPCCRLVWENWQWLQRPQKPQTPPCPCCLPHASCSFHGAPLPICSSSLDTWPFCFCLVTIEGTFQLSRNVLKE